MIKIIHDQRPVPWSRTLHGEKTDRKQAQDKYIADLALLLKVAAEGQTFEGAVRAQLRFDYLREQTLIQLYEIGSRPDLKTTRGDLDNLCKMVLEAVELSGIVKDDAQIAIIEAEKVK